MSTEEIEKLKSTVADTLAYAAQLDGDNRLGELMRDMANELREMPAQELQGRACCFICDEVTCDDDCPLRSVPRNDQR